MASATLSPPSADQPVFLIIAGPNASGKSSVYRNTDFGWEGRSVWIVNPDLLTARIREIEDLPIDAANLAAVKRIESWLDASIDVHKSVGVETVLSTDKYRRLVTMAKVHSFSIWLIYVVLDSVERNVERARIREKKGGHSVPEEKIRARHEKSLAQMPWFLEQADRAWIFDNSASEPKIIAEKRDGTITLSEDAQPQIVERVMSIKSS